MRSTVKMVLFKILTPYTAIIKLGKSQDIFLYNSDCIHLKEESHIHLGWLEGEEIISSKVITQVNYPFGNRGLMVENRTRNRKVVSSSLRSGRDCWWGEWMYSALSTFNTTTRCPWSRHRTEQLLPRCGSIGCPLLRVCVHRVCVCVCVCVFTAVCVHLELVLCN